MIKRTVYQGHGDFLTLQNLDSVEEFFTIEELRDLKQKLRDLTEIMHFDNLEQKFFAEKLLKIGYIAAHFNYIPT